MKKWFLSAAALCLCVLLIWLLVNVFTGNGRAVLSTENYKIDTKMLDYYIDLEKNDYVEKYTREYGNYFLQAAGLNPEKSLKSQESCYGGTWYDYFKNLAIEKLKTELLYCEAAKRDGLESDKAVEKNLNKEFKTLFKDISNSDLNNVVNIEALSQTYLSVFTDSLEPSGEEKTEYYEKNRNLFDCVDYNRIVINDDVDGNSETDDTGELSQKIIDSIKAVGFEETLRVFDIAKNNERFEVDYETGYFYNDETQFGSWAFSDDRKNGDAVCFSGRGMSSVYYIKKTAYPFDYKLNKIQKIALNAAGVRDSIDDLHEIEDKLSGDNNTSDNLLKYADDKGFVVEETEPLKEDLSLSLNNWIYDTKHNIGDFTVLEDGYSISFVRYLGEGQSYFETRLKNAIVEQKLNAHLKQLKKEFKITKS